MAATWRKFSPELRAVLQGELPSFVATYACPFNGLYHWFQVLISVVEIKGRRDFFAIHKMDRPLFHFVETTRLRPASFAR